MIRFRMIPVLELIELKEHPAIKSKANEKKIKKRKYVKSCFLKQESLKIQKNRGFFKK